MTIEESGSEVPSKLTRCPMCLMPSHAVTLSRDEKSCSYCTPDDSREAITAGETFIPNDNKGWSIDDIKNLREQSGGKYDCLVGLTGGRDSTFILYYIKKVLNLNPLAVNFSSPFQSEEAKHNMLDATSRLGVDFESYSIDSTFFNKLAKGFFIKHGEFCSPCHKGHHFTLAKFASEHGIRVIIRGISSKIDLNKANPKYFSYFCQSEDEFNERVKNMADEFDITNEELSRHQKMTHIQSWKDQTVLTIDLPDLLDWGYDEIQNVLDNEFDWKHPEGQFFHCDCVMNPTLCYTECAKHGYSEKQIVISNLLASKDIPIEKGKELLLMEEMPTVPPNINDILKYLDVDRPAFDRTVDKFWKSQINHRS
jgi:PP-loop superfamily ATP-utilizing enzyme